MSGSSPFLKFIKNEFKYHISQPSFPGFLAIMYLIIAYAFATPDYQMSAPIMQEIHLIFVFTGMVVVVFFVFISSRSFAREFETRTMNILVTTPLGKSKIFFGKLISILLLIPLIVLVLLLAIGTVAIFNGTIPNIEVYYTAHRMALFILYIISMVAFTTLVSVLTRKSSTANILTMLYIFISIPIGMAFGMTQMGSPIYTVQFLFPAALNTVGLSMVMNQKTDPLLFITQIIFLTMMLILGFQAFRRSQLWG